MRLTTARRRGRPRTAGLLTLADVFDAVADRLEAELPVGSEEIASDVGISRRSLCRVVLRDSGLTWPAWILPILRTWTAADVEDGAVKRITLTLADDTFTALRRAALAELRDPRLEARRILEGALTASDRRDGRDVPRETKPRAVSR